MQPCQEWKIQLRCQVGGQEPQRHTGTGGQQLDDLRVNPGQPCGPEPGEHDREEDGGGADEPQHAGLHEVEGAAAPGP